MSLRESLNIQSNPDKDIYYPSYEVFESPSKQPSQNHFSQQRKSDQQSNMFPSGRVLQQFNQNQFHVSGNSSFKYFSEPKLTNEQTQAELERQRRYCYSDEVCYHTNRYSNSQNISNNQNNTFPGEENEKVISQTQQLKHQDKAKMQLDTQSKFILGFKLSANRKRNLNNESNLLSNNKSSTQKVERKSDSHNQSYSVGRNSRTQQNISQQKVNNNSLHNSFNTGQDSVNKNYDDASNEKNYDDNPSNTSFLDDSFMESATNQLIHRNDSSFMSSMGKRKRGIFKDCLFIVSIIAVAYFALSTYAITQKYFQDKTTQTQSKIDELQVKNQYFNEIITASNDRNNNSLDNYQQEQRFAQFKGYKQYERKFDVKDSDFEDTLRIEDDQSNSQKIILLAERYYMRFLMQIQQRDEWKAYRNDLIVQLIKEQQDDYQEIFEQIKAIRVLREEILEVKTDDGLYIWISK